MILAIVWVVPSAAGLVFSVRWWYHASRLPSLARDSAQLALARIEQRHAVALVFTFALLLPAGLLRGSIDWLAETLTWVVTVLLLTVVLRDQRDRRKAFLVRRPPTLFSIGTNELSEVVEPEDPEPLPPE